MKRRVLIVGPTRYSLPLSESLRKKFEALDEHFEYRVLARGSGEEDGFRLQPSGMRFYAELPARLARELREFRPDAVLAQDPHTAASAMLGRTLARTKTPIVLEVHGNWRTAARMYGSPARQLLGPGSDVVAARAVRRADGVRTISPYTTASSASSGGSPTASSRRSPTSTRSCARRCRCRSGRARSSSACSSTTRASTSSPTLGGRPAARARGVAARDRQGLAPRGDRSDPRAGRLDRADRPAGVAEALDRAWALVLPSRSEGMGRVILEAFCRNRRWSERRRRDRRPRPRRRERAARPAARPGRARRGDGAGPLRPRARRAARAGNARGGRAAAGEPRGIRTPPARDRRRGRCAVKLVFVTQQVDPGHPGAGGDGAEDQGAGRARRRGRRPRRPGAAGRAAGELPHAQLRGAVAGRPRRAVRGGARRRARPPPAAVVAHMCPIYAVLAAPVVRPVGVRVLLWYTHWRASRLLRLAERVSNAVLTVDRRTFPLDSEKVRPIGHGIDLSEFACSDNSVTPDLRAVALGRYSAAKGLETVLRAVRLALDDGLDLRLEVHGPALTPEERAHRGELERLVAELELDKRVKLGHAVLRSEVPELLRARRRARQQHARRRDRQGRLRGVRELRAGDRLQSGLRHAAPGGAPLRPRRPALAGRQARGPRAAHARGAPQPRPRAARARRRRALGRARGRPRSSRRRAGDDRSACPEGEGDLRLGEPPAVAAPRPPRARLGRADADAPRARARGGGVRA